MIARVWHGQTLSENAEAYCAFLIGHVFAGLRNIPGHLGAFVLQRPGDGRTEFQVTTLWRSMEAVREFAGPNSDTAVIEPHARKLLIEFNHFVRHYEVAFASEDMGNLNDGGHSKQITK
jgi:heme-degrading monooxygenase HmoA